MNSQQYNQGNNQCQQNLSQNQFEVNGQYYQQQQFPQQNVVYQQQINQQPQQPQQSPKQLQKQHIFGIIYPGTLPQTEFEVINDMYCMDLVNPHLVTSISFFLFSSLPENYAAVLYYSAPPYQTLGYLGAIANQRPSDIFHTGFGMNPTVNQSNLIKLVVKIELIESIKDVALLSQNNDIQKDYAKLVAQNLFNFMLSFQQEGILQSDAQGKYLAIPNNFLEKWLHKFELQYKIDPNFIYKTMENKQV